MLHDLYLIGVVLCSVFVRCMATTIIARQVYPADTLLKLLTKKQSISNGTRFAHMVAEVPFETKGVESNLIRALQVGSIDSLFGTKTYTLPSYGRCHLSEQDSLSELNSAELNLYFEKLFQLVANYTGPGCNDGEGHSACVRLNITLSRYDLFHAHLLHNPEADVAVLLFHSMEYPKISKDFPYSLGYCQANSTEEYRASAYPFRNFLWVLPLSESPQQPRQSKAYQSTVGSHASSVHVTDTSTGRNLPPGASSGSYDKRKRAVPILWVLDGREPSLVWSSVLNPYNRALYTAEADRLGKAVADVFSLSAFQTPMWYSFS